MGIDNRIYIALGFHVNCNHSWRGDRNDESGFGTDIRVIRGILDILDQANSENLAACGTWDFDNYWSLGNVLPRFAPDIIERIKVRAAAGTDEIILDSWNNGLTSASTPSELDETIRRTISSPDGSGVKDVFGAYSPIIRTQETVFTQGNIETFIDHGIRAISLYYSSIPFDSVRNFIPPLTADQMYNPLLFNSTVSEASIIMIPTYNQGDVVNEGNFYQWMKSLRHMQETGKISANALVYINMDADADLWTGVKLPGPLAKLPNARGLRNFIDVVNDNSFLEFTSLNKYISDNPPCGEVTLRRDTADGSYCGYYSWTEKEENHRLWRMADRARRLASFAGAIAGESTTAENDAKHITNFLTTGADSYFENKLRLLSTTHFGMHAPAINQERARVAFHLARNAYTAARRAATEAAALIMPAPLDGMSSAGDIMFEFTVASVPREGEPAPPAACQGIPIRIPSIMIPSDIPFDNISLIDSSANPVPFDFIDIDTQMTGSFCATLIFLHASDSPVTYRIINAPGPRAATDDNLVAELTKLQNSAISANINHLGRISSFMFGGEQYSDGALFDLSLTYLLERNRKKYTPRAFIPIACEKGPIGNTASVTLEATIVIAIEGKNYPVKATYTYRLFGSLPYLFVDAQVTFSQTPCKGSESGVSAGSTRKFDMNWFEVMPLLVRPAIHNKSGEYLKVWKHNYMGVTDHYELDFAAIDPANASPDSFNNHVTDGWIGVSGAGKGIIISSDINVNSSPAYCPMRLRDKQGVQTIALNPFGTFHGKQFTQLRQSMGMATWIALTAGNQYRPVAPSYNGRTVRMSMMFAPFTSATPPAALRADAGAHSLPPVVIVHQNNSSRLLPDPVADAELDAAIEEYSLKECSGWSYDDFLTHYNSPAAPVSPVKKHSIFRTIIEGMKYLP